MKKIGMLFVLLTGMFVFSVGCSDKKQPTFAEDVQAEGGHHPIVAEGIDYLKIDDMKMEAGLEIIMVATNSQNRYYDMVEEGAKRAVEDLNDIMGYTGKEKLSLVFDAPKGDDIIEQINIIDQFLDKAPDALCIAFSDAAACKTQMDMAKDNGIKLIAFDTSDEDGETETVVGTDNTKAASIAARKLFEQLENGDKIAVIVHNSAKQTGQDRYRAITNLYNKEYSDKDLHFVEVVYMAQDERSETEIFDQLLEKHPDLAGMICTDLMTTESAVQYIRRNDASQIKLVGFDMSQRIASAIEDQVILGTVAQDPYGMGYATVIAAVRSISGMDNAENVYTDHLWIDSSNLKSEEAKSLFAWER